MFLAVDQYRHQIVVSTSVAIVQHVAFDANIFHSIMPLQHDINYLCKKSLCSVRYCKTWDFHVPLISRISQPLQIRENNWSRIWRAGRPAVFLQQRYPASPGVRLPSVALKSHCRADEGTGVSRCTLSMTMATIPYCGSEPGLTRWSQGVNNWPSASSSAVSSQRRRARIFCSRTSVTEAWCLRHR